MSAHCEFTLFYPVFGTEREGCLFVKGLHTTQARTLPHCSHLHSQSLLDLPPDACDSTMRVALDVIFKTLGYTNQEVCRIDRQDVGQILFKQPQILKIALCLYECFKLASFAGAPIPQLLVHIPEKLRDSAVFK